MRRKYRVMLPILLACMLGGSGCGETKVNTETDTAVITPEETDGFVMEETGTAGTGAEDGMTVPEEKRAPQPLAISLARTHDYDMEDSYITLSYHNFTEAALSEEDAKKLPKLSAALSAYGKERREEAESAYGLLLEDAQKRYDEFYNRESEGICDIALNPYSLENEIFVHRADSSVVSFLEKEVSDSAEYRGVTFDAASGQRLELPKVLTDTSELPELLARRLQEKDPELIAAGLKEYLAQELAENGKLPWTLGYDGITFYVNLKEAASGQEEAVSGLDDPLAVSIGFMEVPELFEEKYIKVPEKYTVCFDLMESLEFNLDGDAELEVLQIRFAADEWGGFSKAVITLDGQEYLDEGYYAFQCRPYLIRANGTHYLYLDGTVENDYRVTRVYELNSEEIRPVETLWSAGVHRYAPSELVFVEELPTNPDRFLLDTRTEVLSTANACRVYHVGADGLPEAETEYYTLNQELVLTTKLPLTVDMINPETGETEAAEELPAGTKVILYRTDNQTYADLKLEDGRICRVAVDLSMGWPQMVNGRNAEECFDGMIFAG